MVKAPKGFIEKLFPILLGGAIIMSFVIGILWEKVSGLEKGGTANTATPGTQQAT